MKQIWELNKYGGIDCECGNTTVSDGFDTCLANGDVVEPTPDSGWDDLYKCMRCDKIAAIVF